MVLSSQLGFPLCQGSAAHSRQGAELCGAGIPWASSVSAGWTDQITLGLVNKRRKWEGVGSWSVEIYPMLFLWQERRLHLKDVTLLRPRCQQQNSFGPGGMDKWVKEDAAHIWNLQRTWAGSWAPLGLGMAGVTWRRTPWEACGFLQLFLSNTQQTGVGFGV